MWLAIDEWQLCIKVVLQEWGTFTQGKGFTPLAVQHLAMKQSYSSYLQLLHGYPYVESYSL